MNPLRPLTIFTLLTATPLASHAQQAPLGGWPQHSRTRPAPPVVTPGAHVQLLPPKDATVLFDGSSLDQWMMSDSSAARWRIVDGAFEVVPGTGTMMTRDGFGDVQLHIEWMAPNPPKGRDQDRGNSGVFFGSGRYEVQVLDSYRNPTYPDGQAASLYGQYPPLVNASRAPGEWQSYDIFIQRAKEENGKVTQPATITVKHNNILVQDRLEFPGSVQAGTLKFQDHLNPVRFRNIWFKPSPRP